jgi:hypothetical protein
MSSFLASRTDMHQHAKVLSGIVRNPCFTFVSLPFDSAAPENRTKSTTSAILVITTRQSGVANSMPPRYALLVLETDPILIEPHSGRIDAEAGPAWAEALATGFDMSLVKISLGKTPWERLLEHDAALDFAAALQGASITRHAKP